MRLPAVLLIVVVAFGLVCFASGATNTYSVTSNDLEVTVEAPAEPVTLANFTFAITITNHDSNLRKIIQIGSKPVCVISVFSKDGRECKRTPAGEKSNGSPAMGWSTAIVPVAPGRSHTWKIPLRDIFVLKPGEYKMTVEFAKARKVEGIHFRIQ